MLPRLLLAIIVITAVFYLMNTFKKGTKKGNQALIIKLFFWLVIGIVLLAVVTGRMHWLGLPIAALLTALKFGSRHIIRALPFLKMFSKYASQYTGNPSFKTSFLTIQLDTNTGTLTGQVISGTHEGMLLAQLSQQQLNTLLGLYKAQDTRSYYLLKAYIFRHSGSDDNSSHNKQEKYSTQNNLFNIEEAFKILGLEKNSSKEEIIKAHKKLIQKVHPDRGGNDFLASQINQAKEILLKNFNA